jgi:uncharacterized protein (TIGR00251 family)
VRNSRDRGSAPDGADAILSVRVAPRSSRNAVAGCSGGVLKIRLTAPPVDDRANEALVRFLSAELRIAPGRIGILSGGRGRNKIVKISGLTLAEVRLRLPALSEESAD